MKKFATLLAVLALASFAYADDFTETGFSTEGTVIGPGPDDCPQGTPFYNHDGSFENGYCWQLSGVVPPYYGAFGSAFDLGPGTVFCGSYWVTQTGSFVGQTADLYVWEDGVYGPPGAVVGVVVGHVMTNVPFWTDVGQNDAEINICVDGPFTTGYWGNWVEDYCGYFCGADLDGFGGIPWTCIAPGIGFPTGWNNPSDIWGPTQDMGLGGYFGQGGTPAEAETWGSIKALFE
jgi:hypothetical protein